MVAMAEHHLVLQRFRKELEVAAIQNERRRQIANSLFQTSKRKGQGGTPSFDRLGKSLNAAEQRSMDLAADAKRFNTIIDHFQLSPAYQSMMSVFRSEFIATNAGDVMHKPTDDELNADFDSLLATMKDKSNGCSFGSQSENM